MDRFYSPKRKVKAKTKSTKESKVERADSLRNAPLRDYCEWESVRCVEGIVVEVEHKSLVVEQQKPRDEVLDIHVLPPTVEYIRVTKCSLRYKLHMRALPRALNDCNVSQNWLWGPVGLRTLPEHLVHLDLCLNRLVGPVDLTELPRNLRTLDLWDNRIRQSVIFFGQLPPNLQYVRFHVVIRTNRIGELRGTSTENVQKLEEMFQGIPLKHIHIE
ncbi:hypothetical protein XU18_1646 [Perkinsela sp. CCAP 1560/4]|nr:hypothetical protein XU18_1646 [Perkinsela sp. CCAP 1560/4]|eukprot:KNH07755.1 hypothetical protein XU18_1646 [Perkinsela sp. CCAP 1560/4]